MLQIANASRLVLVFDRAVENAILSKCHFIKMLAIMIHTTAQGIIVVKW